MKHTPIATVCLCLIAIGLALLPAATHSFLLFDLQQLHSGNPAGLITGHWVHADREHLLWNVSALGILGAMVEVHSRRLLLCGILAGTLSVNLLLLSPVSDISQYCGLSGLLNTLMGLTLFVLWQRTRSRIVIGVGVLCLLKIIVEIALAQSLFTTTSWPPFALAHLAGLAAVPLALWWASHFSTGNQPTAAALYS